MHKQQYHHRSDKCKKAKWNTQKPTNTSYNTHIRKRHSRHMQTKYKPLPMPTNITFSPSPFILFISAHELHMNANMRGIRLEATGSQIRVCEEPAWSLLGVGACLEPTVPLEAWTPGRRTTITTRHTSNTYATQTTKQETFTDKDYM